jgi:hypothetical protein
MTLRSALEDLRETTLAAVSGVLNRLAYLASLRRRDGAYKHWGLAQQHGEGSSERALQTAHTEALSAVLHTPIPELMQGLRESGGENQEARVAYVENMRERLNELLPSPEDTVSAKHLNSVLIALSSLEKSSKRATPSASSPHPPLAQ